jgi:hypothetical protein
MASDFALSSGLARGAGVLRIALRTFMFGHEDHRRFVPFAGASAP